MRQRGTFQLIRSTMQGHKAPDIVGTKGATCLIYTAACIYALDDDGFCQDVLPLSGALSPSMSRIKGAQYMASLEPYSAEGLVPDPRPGVRAIFVGRGEGAKQVLLRTGPITRVDFREGKTERESRSWNNIDPSINWMDDATATHQQLPAVRLVD